MFNFGNFLSSFVINGLNYLGSISNFLTTDIGQGWTPLYVIIGGGLIVILGFRIFHLISPLG